jgi:transcriptional regulator with XRE-family HTH domain
MEEAARRRSIGRAIRFARLYRELTQQELAVKLGMDRKTVGRWERGTDMPSLDLLGPLCDTLRVSPAAFVDPGRIERYLLREE